MKKTIYKGLTIVPQTIDDAELLSNYLNESEYYAEFDDLGFKIADNNPKELLQAIVRDLINTGAKFITLIIKEG